MPKYYKLSVLRDDAQGASWELFYLKIEGDKSKIMLYIPGNIIGRGSDSKLERITEKEMKKTLSDSNVDYGH